MDNLKSNNHAHDLPHVAILMATYNGERFLQEQLDSLVAQTHKNWSLWVSDDGSTDGTLALIRAFAAENPTHQVTIYDGPKLGFAQNFLSLMMLEKIAADYYALSDQDDIWLPEKLTRVVNKMQVTGASLYGGRTIIVNKKGDKIGMSPLFTKPPSFENALVQSIMGGNTMVFDQVGIDLVRKAGLVDVPSHDWWAYILVTGVGRVVHYDHEALILYRQHGDNIIGTNTKLFGKGKRLFELISGDFGRWVKTNICCLLQVSELVKIENLVLSQKILENKWGFAGSSKMISSNVFRQDQIETRLLYVIAFFGKI